MVLQILQNDIAKQECIGISTSIQTNYQHFPKMKNSYKFYRIKTFKNLKNFHFGEVWQFLKYNCCGTCGPINACLISNDVSHLAKALDALENFLQRKKRQIQPQAKHCQRYKVIDLLDLRKHEQAFFMASRQIIEEQHSIIMCGTYRQHIH